MTEQKCLILTNRFDLMSNFGREAEHILEAVHDHTKGNEFDFIMVFLHIPRESIFQELNNQIAHLRVINNSIYL